MMIRRTMLAAVAALSILAGAAVGAQAKQATIGYQLVYAPWALPIQEHTFAKETGYDVRWVKFDSGAKVITAMASGNIDMAIAGSSPIAAGTSQGIDFEVVALLDNIASAEAMVVRDGSGIDIKKPETLKGKTIGVPFVSTTHFHLLYALQLWGIDPTSVRILNMQPNQIAAAWARGDIDAAFVWNPALARIKESGKVMITSGELSKKGKATFDGIVAMRSFAQANPDFMAKFVHVLAQADQEYRQNKKTMKPDSPMVQANVKLLGGEPQDVVDALALYGYPTLEELASKEWLGGGADGGAAKALKYTAEFLKDQGKVDEVKADYANFVNPAYAQAAMKLQQ